MSTPLDINAILMRGEWEEWRNNHLADAAAIAMGARAWCGSTWWDQHTPPLEDWKNVVQDLTPEGLSESILIGAAGSSIEKRPFPFIPLFEAEQVQDVCTILKDADEAAALADYLKSELFLLTVSPEEAPKLCWESMNSDIKAGLDFPAWFWMLSRTEGEPPVLPGRTGIAALLKLGSPRAAEAIRRLEQVRDDSFARILVQLRSAESQGGLTPDGAGWPEDEWIRLCDDLFPPDFDPASWAAVEQHLLKRAVDSSEPHPLSVMADYLRYRHDRVEEYDRAWNNLQRVFDRYPALLNIDEAGSRARLPALELSVVLCPERSLGEIAWDLVLLASEHRQMPMWWKALKAGLRPAERRGGWHFANDRSNLAENLVLLRGRWLPQQEVSAMYTGFSCEDKR